MTKQIQSTDDLIYRPLAEIRANLLGLISNAEKEGGTEETKAAGNKTIQDCLDLEDHSQSAEETRAVFLAAETSETMKSRINRPLGNAALMKFQSLIAYLEQVKIGLHSLSEAGSYTENIRTARDLLSKQVWNAMYPLEKSKEDPFVLLNKLTRRGPNSLRYTIADVVTEYTNLEVRFILEDQKKETVLDWLKAAGVPQEAQEALLALVNNTLPAPIGLQVLVAYAITETYWAPFIDLEFPQAQTVILDTLSKTISEIKPPNAILRKLETELPKQAQNTKAAFSTARRIVSEMLYQDMLWTLEIRWLAENPSSVAFYDQVNALKNPLALKVVLTKLFVLSLGLWEPSERQANMFGDSYEVRNLMVFELEREVERFANVFPKELVGPYFTTLVSLKKNIASHFSFAEQPNKLNTTNEVALLDKAKSWSGNLVLRGIHREVLASAKMSGDYHLSLLVNNGDKEKAKEYVLKEIPKANLSGEEKFDQELRVSMPKALENLIKERETGKYLLPVVSAPSSSLVKHAPREEKKEEKEAEPPPPPSQQQIEQQQQLEQQQQQQQQQYFEQLEQQRQQRQQQRQQQQQQQMRLAVQALLPPPPGAASSPKVQGVKPNAKSIPISTLSTPIMKLGNNLSLVGSPLFGDPLRKIGGDLDKVKNQPTNEALSAAYKTFLTVKRDIEAKAPALFTKNKVALGNIESTFGAILKQYPPRAKKAPKTPPSSPEKTPPE
ncbi:unnamed protein product [Rotaria magnacalcarata]|uniref:Uncharacterized protein n=1 Tax=Rotaria magnacalcarata TaxID=392030 RepID=A0A815MT63_9BILA|nr:unnamed protein product [Rotaria magnacalcarata]CAF3754317.1 unnamed protein product [Rotaria magnacalcarata]